MAVIFVAKNIETYQAKLPQAMVSLENGFDDTKVVLMMPKKYRKRSHTNSAMERFNQEIYRCKGNFHFP